MSSPSHSCGMVYLVGAGPGDPALITRRGADLLRRADVVVHDGLINAVLLDLAPPSCERIYAGKKHAGSRPPLTQDDINRLLIEGARAGKRVVRLKGGDPFVFGRGAEECTALAAAGVPFEVVPGVSSATAVTAYAGIPLTARGVSSTVALATGHEAAGKPTSEVDWEALARAGTIVLFMALKTAAECCQRLVAAGRSPDTPAIAIYWGTTAAQRTVTARLGDLPAAIGRAGLKPPVLLVVGPVVNLREQLSWYESRPLFGVRVLITRGVEQAAAFSHELAELGAEAIVAPVTRIRPIDSSYEVTRAIVGLSSYDWVIFTSANAVGCFCTKLRSHRRDARAFGAARIACIGPATAAALAEHGVFADAVPPHGDAGAVAKEVIDASGAAIRSARVLVPRAADGREEAVTALRAAGAQVDVVPVYTTEIVSGDDAAIRYGLAALRRRRVGAIAFFAPSQVRALFAILGPEAGELIATCKLVAAVGKTTQAALVDRGVAVHVVPSSPSPEIFAAEIAAAYREGR